METRRSTSADRSAISSLDIDEWALPTSRSCWPTVITGLRAFMALCMTTEKSRHRMWRSCLSLIWAISLPRNETLPDVIPAGGLSRLAMAKISVDLPQPDSPTTERNSPFARSRSTLSTATTGPESVA